MSSSGDSSHSIHDQQLQARYENEESPKNNTHVYQQEGDDENFIDASNREITSPRNEQNESAAALAHSADMEEEQRDEYLQSNSGDEDEIAENEEIAQEENVKNHHNHQQQQQQRNATAAAAAVTQHDIFGSDSEDEQKISDSPSENQPEDEEGEAEEAAAAATKNKEQHQRQKEEREEDEEEQNTKEITRRENEGEEEEEEEEGSDEMMRDCERRMALERLNAMPGVVPPTPRGSRIEEECEYDAEEHVQRQRKIALRRLNIIPEILKHELKRQREEEEMGGDDDDEVARNLSAHPRSPPNQPSFPNLEVAEPERETQIAVDFPYIKTDLGSELHLVKLPNFLSVDTRPWDPTYYEDEMDEEDVQDEEGRTRLKLKVENTIRWRVARDEDGMEIKKKCVDREGDGNEQADGVEQAKEEEVERESNARFVRWSDKSLSLYLGDEIFDVYPMDIRSDYNHLFIREGSGLQAQAKFATKLAFRPHSTESFTHKKLITSLADKSKKSAKIKILPMITDNPEVQRAALLKREEERLKSTMKRENQQRRVRERASQREMTHEFLEQDQLAGQNSQNNTISLSDIKKASRGSAGSAAQQRKSALIYSSDSNSDFEVPSRKKKKTRRIEEDDDEGDSD